jgi:hypothetical protein
MFFNMSYSPKFVGNSANVSVTSSRKVSRNYVNGNVGTLARGTPVGTMTSGLVTIIDVSSQTSVNGFVGLFNIDAPSAASVEVLDSGLLENFTTSFAINDPVYVSKAGGLTNIIPIRGSNGFVAGDYVLFLGTIVQNEFDNTKKDIKILIQKPGRL